MLPVLSHHALCCCCSCATRRRRRRRFRWRIILKDKWEYDEIGVDSVYAAVSYWCPYWPIGRPRYFNERNFRGAPIDELVARAHAWQDSEYLQFIEVCEEHSPAPKRYEVKIINVSGFGFTRPTLGRFNSLERARQVAAAWMLKRPGYQLDVANIIDLHTGAPA